MFSIPSRALSWAITSFGNKFCLKMRSRLIKALNNTFCVKFMQLEIGLLENDPKQRCDPWISTKLFDKRDDFDFLIFNFPFMSSNIPHDHSYGVYIVQLVRSAKCCSCYYDFRHRHKMLYERLLSQGHQYEGLEKFIQKVLWRMSISHCETSKVSS